MTSNIDLETNSEQGRETNVDQSPCLDTFGRSWIYITPMILGCIYMFMANALYESDCQYSEGTLFLTGLGASLIIDGIFISLYTNRCYAILPICNTGRIDITQDLLTVCIGTASVAVIVVPTFMVGFLVLESDVPQCMFEPTLFNVVYILTASVFNMISLIILGLCGYIGVKCYSAE